MREVDDNVQLYIPVLRRIIILVAVIIAVPVVLWTITAFVRTYVAPPKVPTFRSLAEHAITEAAQKAAAQSGPIQSLAPTVQQANSEETTATIVEARATATDARGPALDASADAARGAFLGDGARNGDASAAVDFSKVAATAAAAPMVAPITPAAPVAPTGPKVAALTPAPPPKAALAGLSAPSGQFMTSTPDAAPNRTLPLADQQQPAAWPSPPAEALPAVEPISGPVPLPRRRPHLLAMAPISMAQSAAIPLPRNRPTSAPEVTPVETDAPFANLRDYNR